jgi:DNA-binding transcriptional LysR family regulator
MIETRLLRNAIMLAEHRNFARAALALNISQPTLTRNIQTLENHIGARLFDRKTRTVLPTPVGEELLKHARLIVRRHWRWKTGCSITWGWKQARCRLALACLPPACWDRLLAGSWSSIQTSE